VFWPKQPLKYNSDFSRYKVRRPISVLSGARAPWIEHKRGCNLSTSLCGRSQNHSGGNLHIDDRKGKIWYLMEPRVYVNTEIRILYATPCFERRIPIQTIHHETPSLFHCSFCYENLGKGTSSVNRYQKLPSISFPHTSGCELRRPWARSVSSPRKN
jgi:hypothetical protein